MNVDACTNIVPTKTTEGSSTAVSLIRPATAQSPGRNAYKSAFLAYVQAWNADLCSVAFRRWRRASLGRFGSEFDRNSRNASDLDHRCGGRSAKLVEVRRSCASHLARKTLGIGGSVLHDVLHEPRVILGVNAKRA